MVAGNYRRIQNINSTRKMALLEKYKTELKEPKKKAVIQQAIKHENKLKFFTENHLNPNTISGPTNEFLDWVGSLLPKDKYITFLHLFRFPLPTLELSEKIFNELERVFDGRNPSESFRFADPELAEDWSEYQKEKLNNSSVWRDEAWDNVKTSINSVLIVDLPEEQETELPEPYFYFLDISQVITYESDDKGNILWIAFKQEEDQVAIFDEEFYRIVKIDSDNEIIELLVENPHTLGYCPAAFFWSDSLTKRNNDLKKSPISPQLSNMDWLLFFATSKKHLDLYAPYPIYSVYESDCDFENVENGDFCDGGFLRGEDENYKVFRDGTLEKCPVCAEKKLSGVGSVIEVPIPEKDGVDLSDPIKITSIDKDSLDFNVEELERLDKNIYKAVVGAGGQTETREALNEKHIISNYDAKTSVLNNIKVNIEKAKKFVYDTCCRLRYGDQFIGSHINMGTEFYIASVDDLYRHYKQAKENGANESELDIIKDQIVLTEHRTDPQMLQRMLILRQLEPLRHNTRSETLELFDKKLIDEESMIIKINFNNFIDKFERENINILDFGSNIAFDKKIESIFNELKSYVKKRDTPGESLSESESES